MDQPKRYQIFVSSTYTDLKTERGKVMETILSHNCFPAGMEMFPAMDEEQFEYIKRIIDDSDYYLLIIGGRYGSMDKDGKSWTEKEYDYAVSKGIPVIIFDHEDFTKLPVNKTDQNDKKRRKLVKFKKKAADRKLIKYWTNADDLALAVSTSLRNVLQLQPRIGWVRANSVISDDEQIEIERLKKEIGASQKKVKRLEKKVEGLEAELKKLRPLVIPRTKSFKVKGISFKMVLVEGGTFMMGAKEGEEAAYSNEKPAHKVTLSDYWIAETPVTQELWLKVMDKNPSFFKGNLKCPVENVSWEDCDYFLACLSDMVGKEFHLPTEAQWEFAARGGKIGKDNHHRFAGSNDIYDVAYFSDNSEKQTHPVKDKKPNELGLYDMTGNVWEWCNDKVDDSDYSNSPTVDSSCHGNGSRHVCRGGSWNSNTRHCRVSCRSCDTQTDKDARKGLRLVLNM